MKRTELCRKGPLLLMIIGYREVREKQTNGTIQWMEIREK